MLDFNRDEYAQLNEFERMLYMQRLDELIYDADPQRNYRIQNDSSSSDDENVIDYLSNGSDWFLK